MTERPDPLLDHPKPTEPTPLSPLRDPLSDLLRTVRLRGSVFFMLDMSSPWAAGMPDGTTLAVLDWELSTLGDPLADVSYLLRSWLGPADAAGGAGPPSAAAGFPSRDEVAERYAAASGRTLDDLDFWMALNAWRSAAIAEGVYRRYVDGKMGEPPPDVDKYARSVEFSAHEGLVSAGLA